MSHYDGGIRQKDFEAFVQKVESEGYKVTTVVWECEILITPQK